MRPGVIHVYVQALVPEIAGLELCPEGVVVAEAAVAAEVHVAVLIVEAV